MNEPLRHEEVVWVVGIDVGDAHVVAYDLDAGIQIGHNDIPFDVGEGPPNRDLADECHAEHHDRDEGSECSEDNLPPSARLLRPVARRC